MAFPVVAEVAESNLATAGTSHVVTHPTVAAGELWILILDKGSTSATVNAHADWTELLDEASANGLYIAYRWTTGAEGASTTLVTSASTRSAQMVYRITGAENPATTAPQIGTTGTGTSATPDPPASATPPSSKDYLFIAFAGMAGEEADDDTWGNTPPTNYTPSPPRQKSCGVAGTNLGGLILSAEFALTTGVAQNPGTFGVDASAAWRSQTITVHPSTAAPVSVTPDTAALTTATFAPVVTATDNQTVTPGIATLTLATFAPTVTVAPVGSFPTLTTTFGQIATNTVLTAPLPSTAAAGDLAFAFIAQDGIATGTWSGSAVELLDHQGTGFNYHIAYLICAGGETSMVCTSTLSERANYISGIIPAASWHGSAPPEISTGATGNSTGPDPDTLTASWGSDSNLWIATLGADSGLPMSAWPTNYTDNNVESFGLTSAGELAIATRGLAAASDDPGAFTMSISDTWSAFTLVVRPAAGGGAGVSVTPSTAALTLTAFAPVVSATNNVAVTPGTASLSLATFTPTILTPRLVTPTNASLVLATFAPSVTATANQSVTPAKASLVIASFAPTVSTTANQSVTPNKASLILASFAPTVTAGAGLTITPNPASLALTAFAPSVVLTDHKLVTPNTASLTLATFAPTVSGAAGTTITPTPASLALTAFAPNVVVTDQKTVTPGPASLGLSTFAPVVTGSAGTTVTPGTASLVMAMFAPTVTASGTTSPGTVGAVVGIRDRVAAAVILRDQVAVATDLGGSVGAHVEFGDWEGS
jgi:hypothetical protein